MDNDGWQAVFWRYYIAQPTPDVLGVLKLVGAETRFNYRPFKDVSAILPAKLSHLLLFTTVNRSLSRFVQFWLIRHHKHQRDGSYDTERSILEPWKIWCVRLWSLIAQYKKFEPPVIYICEFPLFCRVNFQFRRILDSKAGIIKNMLWVVPIRRPAYHDTPEHYSAFGLLGHVNEMFYGLLWCILDNRNTVGMWSPQVFAMLDDNSNHSLEQYTAYITIFWWIELHLSVKSFVAAGLRGSNRKALYQSYIILRKMEELTFQRCGGST